jgi:hypothetical protein
LFIKFAEKRAVPFIQADFEFSKQALSVYIKASMARALWNTGEYVEIINETDLAYLKAVEIVDRWDYYQEAK